jgi:hypothetical protein
MQSLNALGSSKDVVVAVLPMDKDKGMDERQQQQHGNYDDDNKNDVGMKKES